MKKLNLISLFCLMISSSMFSMDQKSYSPPTQATINGAIGTIEAYKNLKRPTFFSESHPFKITEFINRHVEKMQLFFRHKQNLNGSTVMPILKKRHFHRTSYYYDIVQDTAEQTSTFSSKGNTVNIDACKNFFNACNTEEIELVAKYIQFYEISKEKLKLLNEKGFGSEIFALRKLTEKLNTLVDAYYEYINSDEAITFD